MSSFEEGHLLGRYRVEAFLAQGGMGRVYRAVDTLLGRRVALKVLAESDRPGCALRFQFGFTARGTQRLDRNRFRVGVTVMGTILIIILILLLIGAFPAWPYSTGWGYFPTGGIGLILLIVLILVLSGRI